jgi:Tol biopolymer transport system component
MARRALILVATLGIALAAGSSGGASSIRLIVFAASPQHGTQPSQLFRISTGGTGLRQLTTGARAADEPTFSPDGRRVAFTRAFAGIFVIDADGSGLHRLTGDPNDRFPVWSPDGRSVAFLHPVAGAVRLAVIASSGHRQRTLRLGPHPTGRPSWAANGKSLVIPSDGSFFQVSASTGKVQRRLRPTYDFRDGAPSWTLSPNGRRIALVARRPEPPGCQGLACEVFALYVTRVSSARPRRLVDDAGFAGWTADSRRVVYATGDGLKIQPVAGGAARLIRIGSGGEIQPIGDAPPAWQP